MFGAWSAPYARVQTAQSCPNIALYEVLGRGYHTALTKTQVEQLFQAGRISRNTPCKRVEADQWRSVDDLFPLLKYDSSGWSESEELFCESRNSTRVLFGCVLVATALTAAIYALLEFWPRELPVHSELPIVYSMTPPPVVAVQPRTTAQPLRSGYSAPRPTPVKAPLVASFKPVAAPRSVPPAVSAPLPLTGPAAAAAPAPSHRDVVVPLDVFTVVNDVGGVPVTLKVRDVDVTTIEVSTGTYSSPVRLTKQKGISHSGTDETLIYTNGRASLYYVWEISGTLNHCLLRVRES